MVTTLIPNLLLLIHSTNSILILTCLLAFVVEPDTLAVAPVAFSVIAFRITGALEAGFCLVIAAVDEDAMIRALEALFGRLANYNVKLSLPKSLFFRKYAEYCGIRVSAEGFCISDKRKKKLEEYPDYNVRSKKKNKDLSLLGFYNWHRRFVENYAENLRRKLRKRH